MTTVSSLINTSASDAAITLSGLADRDPEACLKLSCAALKYLNDAHQERASHRKAFASAARRAIKQLEQGHRA